MDLDVGCGPFMLGDVNVDVRTYPKKPFCEFLKASAEYLPFRDNSFAKVISYDCIEHVPDPFKMMLELVRVSSWYVEVKTPHWTSLLAHNKDHKWIIPRKWFERFCRKYKLGFLIYVEPPVGLAVTKVMIWRKEFMRRSTMAIC
jgi:ubiquinone/menaquinone biosynthesis C-methylase UbiE